MGKEQQLLDYILGLPDLEAVRENPEKVLAAIDKFAEKEPLMTIGKFKGNLILDVIAEKEPTLMIELGCYVGYSAILFGSALSKVNTKIKNSGCTLSKYFSFEINEEFAEISRKLIDLAGLSECVEIIVGPAGQTLPDFEQRVGLTYKKYTAVDLIFIDHWKDMYVPDLRVLESLGLVGPGTVLCADNIYNPGAPEYVEYVQGTPQARKDHNSSVPNVSNKLYPGRWNILYESKTHPVHNPETGMDDAVEITKCVSYLLG